MRNLYGNPSLIEENRDIFSLPIGKLVATYSSGECTSTDPFGGWRSPKDTLITVDMEVGDNVVFSSLKIKTNGLKQIRPADTPQLTILRDNEVGIEYSLQRDRLSDVYAFPSRLQREKSCNRR